MTVLAWDTSASGCSAAVWRDGRILASRRMAMARGQSEVLMPMIRDVMAEAGVAFHELALLGVTVGPGTFTGIRIGLAAARAVALAAKLPLVGVTTTEAVAAGVAEDERAGRTVLACIDAKRAELFVQPFAEDGTALAEPTALDPAAAAALVSGPVVLAGDGAALVQAHRPDALLARSPAAPDAGVVAVLARRHFDDGTALPPLPLYLRAPDVTLPDAAA